MTDYDLGGDCKLRRDIKNILELQYSSDKCCKINIKFSDLDFFNFKGDKILSIECVDCSLEKIQDKIEDEIDRLYKYNIIVPLNYMIRYNCVICNKEVYHLRSQRRPKIIAKGYNKGVVLGINSYFCDDCFKELYNEIRIDSQAGSLSLTKTFYRPISREYYEIRKHSIS